MPNVMLQALQSLFDAESSMWDTNEPPTPNGPSPNIYPRPLLSDPGLQRAVTKIDKTYPQDTAGVDITTTPWADPAAGSNTLGSTWVKRGPQHIEINPALSMGFPQSAVEHTLAHELEHVRQNRRSPAVSALDELQLPYFDRPSEKAAREAANQYDTEQGAPAHWSGDLNILRNLPKIPRSQ